MAAAQDPDTLAINTIRTLSIDAVQAANSGHPGTPMALAPLVYTLWNRVMRFDPQDPIWPNRDRFVLSNGHASMLLWSVLYLTGTRAVNAEYERLGEPAVTLDDIRRFRQLGSKAPGHPEYHWVSGVETTTGPLGQGIATSVGMAIGQRWLASRYNRPGFDIFDYAIYAVCGDGCLMEGVGSEAASLAGHLGLDNLCWIYDNNHITIEGSTKLSVHRGRRGAIPGLRVERAARRRRERHRAHRECAADLPADQGPADADHPRQPHRLRLAAPAGHRRRARRAARRRRGPPRQARVRLARGREVPRSGRGARAFRCRHRCARGGSASPMDGPVRGLHVEVLRARDRDRADAAARASFGMGPQPARLSRRCEGHRGTRRVGPGAERSRAEHSVVRRRLGGSRALEQDDAQVRRRGRLRARNARAERTCISESASMRWRRS